MQEKIDYLQKHIFDHVSKSEFESYRKYQTVELAATVERLETMVDKSLSPEVRDYIPIALAQRGEIAKISSLVENQGKIVRQIEDINRNLEEQIRQSSQMIFEKVEGRVVQLQNETMKYANGLEQRLQDVENVLLHKISEKEMKGFMGAAKESIFTKISQVQEELTQKMNVLIKTSGSEIYNLVTSLVPQEQKQQWIKLKESIPRIDQIRQAVEKRCDDITATANGLSDTLEQYSNRITKIKTDLELKDDVLTLQIKYLKKAREEADRRFGLIGKLFGVQSQTLIGLNILVIHTILKQRKFQSLGVHDNQVFVSFTDGFIHEIKQNIVEEYVTYRKKSINSLDMSCALLTCLIGELDAYHQEEFMGWDKNKPSNYFKYKLVEQLQHEARKVAPPSIVLHPIAPSLSAPRVNSALSKITPGPTNLNSSTVNPIQEEEARGTDPISLALERTHVIQEVKDDSIEIFAKTADLRRRSFNRLRNTELPSRGAQTSRQRSRYPSTKLSGIVG